MGLPVLTVETELATSWRSILEENGLRVHLDQDEIEKERLLKEEVQIAGGKQEGENAPKWTSTPWVVANENAETGILETTLQDQRGGDVYLVFIPNSTRAGRQLFLHIQRILLASGAIQGRKK